jgi:hypothetical protein
MSPKRSRAHDDDLRPEYDFRHGIRGKYLERYRQGTNVVLLDPDVAAVFKDRASVNDALRALVAVADASVNANPRTASTPSERSRRPKNSVQSRIRKRRTGSTRG